MNIQRATIEVTSINYFFQTSPEEEGTWRLNLSGEFTNTSQSNIGGKPKIEFRGSDFKLQDSWVLISLKPLPINFQSTRAPASDPWQSNDDSRDTLRIDGLKEGGHVHSQISIFVDQPTIDSIRNVSLKNHRLIIEIKYIDDIKDPRPLQEESVAHLFTYLTKSSIHILSNKDRHHMREYFALLDEKITSSPNIIDKIEPITDLLQKIINDFRYFNKLIKGSVIIIIILLLANLFKS